MYFHYLIVFVLLFAGILIYFKIADKYNIIDKPNERSSHTYITLRGGGIIFWLAGLIYSVMHLPRSIWFLLGITLISGVSLWDDIKSLPNRVRIIIHFLSISSVFYMLGIFTLLPWWLTLIAYIFFVGVLNAYNFMDGINGITGLYSLAILIAMQYVNQKLVPFTDADFINYPILACIVFLFFNYRKRAKCFAGDVGSMAISFWVVTLLLQLMLASNSLIWISFLLIYGVDSICTILHRLALKQNIFKPHRMHYYQILSNERKMQHRLVSVIYALLQLLICAVVINIYQHQPDHIWWASGGILLLLIAVYLTKFSLIKKPR